MIVDFGLCGFVYLNVLDLVEYGKGGHLLLKIIESGLWLLKRDGGRGGLLEKAGE